MTAVPPARLTILYFAWVRDLIGRAEDVIEHPGAECSVASLLDRLSADSAAHAAAFADRLRLRAALDQDYVSLDVPLGAGRELAIFPPVTGGCA